jgi:hypothetical protein
MGRGKNWTASMLISAAPSDATRTSEQGHIEESLRQQSGDQENRGLRRDKLEPNPFPNYYWNVFAKKKKNYWNGRNDTIHAPTAKGA